MKKLKKYLFFICALALVVVFTGCKKSSGKDYSNQTVRGQVTEINGNKVTLKMGNTPPDGQQPPNMPGGNGQPPSNSQSSDSSEIQDVNSQQPAPPSDSTSQSDQSGNGNQPPAPPQDSTAQDGQSGSNSQQPPAPPSGSNSGQDSNGQPPTPPSDNNGGQPPAMPNENGGQQQGSDNQGETDVFDLSGVSITKDNAEISVNDIAVGDTLEITFGDSNNITGVKVGTMGMGGESQQEVEGSSANTIEEDGTFENKEYTSTGKDENALLIKGATVTLNNVIINKSAGESSNAGNGDFYGINAALLAKGGANLTINNATVNSSAQNGNGIFSYGSGTKVTVSDTKITTTGDNSGGIQTTGGATTIAKNLTISTAGNSSAAIRSDRGGGTVDVSCGSYTSNGFNSPAIYSTANISVKDAALKATNSEAVVIEGKNSVTLENCTTEGNMSSTDGASSDENVHNIMIYQSMSGDAEEGTSSFSAKGGTITSNNGDFIYVTNTKCTIDLSGVKLINNSKSGNLLTVSGNSASKGWGKAGSNGGDAAFTASNQQLEGNIVVDSISKLNLTLKDNSTLTGAVNITENTAVTAVSDNAVITVENGSTWNLTGNCKITSLDNKGTINFNGYTVTLADGTVLKA